MNLPRTARRVSAMLVAGVSGLLIATLAMAQPAGPGTGARQGGGKQPPGKSGGGGGSQPPQPAQPIIGKQGNGKATIKKFVPVKNGSPGDAYIGHLNVSFRNQNLKMAVPGNFTMTFANRNFTSADITELFQPGLSIDVSWDTESVKKRDEKVIKSATLVTTSVEGEISKTEDKDGLITLHVKPTDGALWPDQEEKRQRAQSTGVTAAATPKVPFRNLKMKALADTSKILDEANNTLTTAELQQDQKVQAVVVLGGKFGVIAELKVVTGNAAKSDKGSPPPPPKGDGPIRPGKPGGRDGGGGG